MDALAETVLRQIGQWPKKACQTSRKTPQQAQISDTTFARKEITNG